MTNINEITESLKKASQEFKKTLDSQKITIENSEIPIEQKTQLKQVIFDIENSIAKQDMEKLIETMKNISKL